MKILVEFEKRPNLVIFGGNSSLNYLIQRYATRIRYNLSAAPPAASAESIYRLGPEAVIFLSLEILESSSQLVAGLTNHDIPVVVCAGTVDQVRTRTLGADYCLLHPLLYENFRLVLEAIASQKKRGEL